MIEGCRSTQFGKGEQKDAHLMNNTTNGKTKISFIEVQIVSIS